MINAYSGSAPQTHACSATQHWQAPPQCSWDDSDKALKITSAYLSKSEIQKLLEELPISLKQEVSSLDFSSCHDLTSLQVDGKPLLQDFSNLKHLSLPKTSSFNDISGISAVTSTLQSLNVSKTGIKDLAFLSDIPNLHAFDADQCAQLKDIKGIENCTELQKLILNKCTGVASPKFKAIANLRKLEICKLNGTSSFNNLTHFTNLTNLKHVNIQGSKVPKTAAWPNPFAPGELIR